MKVWVEVVDVVDGAGGRPHVDGERVTVLAGSRGVVLRAWPVLLAVCHHHPEDAGIVTTYRLQ
jgi:hypothetical protein